MVIFEIVNFFYKLFNLLVAYLINSCRSLGILTLGSTEEDSLAEAKEMVMLIIDPPEVEVDTDYDGE
mgnify:CR=1